MDALTMPVQYVEALIGDNALLFLSGFVLLLLFIAFVFHTVVHEMHEKKPANEPPKQFLS